MVTIKISIIYELIINILEFTIHHILEYTNIRNNINYN